MTVTYDATHQSSAQVSPMTRLTCHLCRELTHLSLAASVASWRGVSMNSAKAPTVVSGPWLKVISRGMCNWGERRYASTCYTPS
jgi:ABC-type enterobactin transport system permease subunit